MCASNGYGGYPDYSMGAYSQPTPTTGGADPFASAYSMGVSQPPQGRPLPTAPMPPIQNSDYVDRSGSFVPPPQPSGGPIARPPIMGLAGNPFDPQQQASDQAAGGGMFQNATGMSTGGYPYPQLGQQMQGQPLSAYSAGYRYPMGLLSR